MKIGNNDYSRQEIEKKVGNLQQIGGTRHYILNEGKGKGISAIDFNTGSGFNFTVLTDRGLDISRATYKGINLAYLTPNGEVNPAYYEPGGMGWLHNFFGGLLTTCGLTHFGPPGEDEGEELGLHGRYTNTPAFRVNDLSSWRGEEYVLEISGIVENASLFGHKMRMERTISANIGEKSLKIVDLVKNFGYEQAPFNILYHANAGFPILDGCSELVVSASGTTAANPHSEKDIDKVREFTAPVNGFDEQNYLHKMAADKDGYGYVAMINPDLANGLGLYIKFKIDNLPFLNEWKMMGSRDYVVGIEPCNVKIENRAVLREQKILPFLAAGEEKKMVVEIGVLEGEKEIADFKEKVTNIVKD